MSDLNENQTPPAPDNADTVKTDPIPSDILGDTPASKTGDTVSETPKTPETKRKGSFLFKSGGLGSKTEKKPEPQKPQAAPTSNVAAGSSKPNAGATPSNVPRGALNSVVTRNEYYRDGYRNIVKLALIEGIVIVLMVVTFIVYTNVHKGADRYFATTADGRILQLLPLDQPNMSTPAIMSWVSQAATEVMTFGFHDYQRRLQDASRHFTRLGWESFTTALQKSRIIEGVESLQQVVTAAPASAPILLQEGIFNGRYRWVVKLPLTVTFRSGSQSTTSNLNVTITIERVPTLESPNGVGIESWVAL